MQDIDIYIFFIRECSKTVVFARFTNEVNVKQTLMEKGSNNVKKDYYSCCELWSAMHFSSGFECINRRREINHELEKFNRKHSMSIHCHVKLIE